MHVTRLRPDRDRRRLRRPGRCLPRRLARREGGPARAGGTGRHLRQRGLRAEEGDVAGSRGGAKARPGTTARLRRGAGGPGLAHLHRPPPAVHRQHPRKLPAAARRGRHCRPAHARRPARCGHRRLRGRGVPAGEADPARHRRPRKPPAHPGGGTGRHLRRLLRLARAATAGGGDRWRLHRRRAGRRAAGAGQPGGVAGARPAPACPVRRGAVTGPGR